MLKRLEVVESPSSPAAPQPAPVLGPGVPVIEGFEKASSVKLYSYKTHCWEALEREPVTLESPPIFQKDDPIASQSPSQTKYWQGVKPDQQVVAFVDVDHPLQLRDRKASSRWDMGPVLLYDAWSDEYRPIGRTTIKFAEPSIIRSASAAVGQLR